MPLLTPDETEAALARLTDEERAVRRMVLAEGTLCGHQLSDAERKIATRLVRRGLLSSERRGDCEKRHYF